VKGIVFTEFAEWIEHRWGVEVLDEIHQASELRSGGAYTAVGTYDHEELVQLVVQLAVRTQCTVRDLLIEFGQHLFGRFAAGYPEFFKGVPSAFSFLERVEHHIHTEVRKLYPDAQLPHVDCEAAGDDSLTVIYRSARPFADLAEGLILGCLAHFGELVELERHDLESVRGTAVRFLLTKRTTNAGGAQTTTRARA